MITLYALNYGASGAQAATGAQKGTRSTTLFWPFTRLPDALVVFSHKVLEFDQDPEITGAYVTLRSITYDPKAGVHGNAPQGVTLAGWTKTSNERPNHPGAFNMADAAQLDAQPALQPAQAQ